MLDNIVCGFAFPDPRPNGNKRQELIPPITLSQPVGCGIPSFPGGGSPFAITLTMVGQLPELGSRCMGVEAIHM